MQNDGIITRNIFDRKNAIEKIVFCDVISGEIQEPNFLEGETVLTIVKYKAEEMYGKNLGNVKVEFICEDDEGNRLTQMFVLKGGRNNNFARFIFQILECNLEDEINLKELEGRRIIATVAHSYNELGFGYANIAYCRPIESIEIGV